MEERLLVGVDLCRDYTQLACWNERAGEPDSIGTRGEKYLIPTRLAVRQGSRDWVIGEEAVRLIELEEAIDAGALLEKAGQETVTEILTVEFTPTALLERYFRKLLNLIRREYPEGKIACLVVSLEEEMGRARNGRNGLLRETAIRQALTGLGLEAERIQIQSHMTSFLYYMLGQKKELWKNDVALFDFQREGLRYAQLSVNSRVQPMVATVTERDLSDILKTEMVSRDPEMAGIAFQEAAQTALYRKVISSVYATGRGFEGEWVDAGLASLAAGRKVFKGQNLFARGACYFAHFCQIHPVPEKQILFLGEEHTSSEWSMEVYRDGQIRRLVLMQAAKRWEEARCRWDFILDDTEKLELQVRDFVTGKSQPLLVELEGLPLRARKQTRIRLDIWYTELRTARIRVTDLGFGEITKYSREQESGKTWESIVHF